MSALKQWRVTIGFIEKEKNRGSFTPAEREKILVTLMSGEEKPDSINWYISSFRKPYEYRVFEVIYMVEASSEAEAEVLGHKRKNEALCLLSNFGLEAGFCRVT